MASENPPLTLTVPSDLRFVAAVRSFMEAVCRASQLDPKLTDAIVLATNEAINNVIRHGQQPSADATLEVKCYLGPDLIEIHILDQGEPFDLTHVPNLDPAELRIGGRGVFLMRTLMDELSCQPRDGRGNLLRMVKRRDRKSSPVSQT